jgi:methylmalonyl-CoA mutase cobalamin-binding subunit
MPSQKKPISKPTKRIRILVAKPGLDGHGGGIIPDEDKPLLEKQGITGNFGPGTSLKTIIEHVESVVSERDSKKKR